MDRGYSVLVIEENDVLREKIAGLISRSNSVGLVAQVSTKNYVCSAVETIAPDVIFTDISFASQNKELFERCLAQLSDIRLIFYTNDMCREYKEKANRLGASSITDVLRIQDTIRDLFREPLSLSDSFAMRGGTQ